MVFEHFQLFHHCILRKANLSLFSGLPEFGVSDEKICDKKSNFYSEKLEAFTDYEHCEFT